MGPILIQFNPIYKKQPWEKYKSFRKQFTKKKGKSCLIYCLNLKTTLSLNSNNIPIDIPIDIPWPI